MNKTIKRTLTILFIASLGIMLLAYFNGYSNSINWEVTTTGEVIQFPAWEMDSGLVEHQIIAEKYLLQESYAGGEIKRNLNLDYLFLGGIWIALCLVLTGASYLKRYAFFVVVALFALLLNRLNLHEVGLFGYSNKLILFVPFLSFLIPLVVFHEYKKETAWWIRLSILLLVSAVPLLGVDNANVFVDHFIAHSLFGFTICGLVFLFLITEEIVFAILYVITSSRGGSNNHLHFILLSIIYLGNIILYYLNKSGIYDNSFFFFDPFILLAVTSIVALWSIKFKAKFLSGHLSEAVLFTLFIGLGIISFLFLGHQFIRGNDGVFEAFHYFIVYFHIGFGVLFFLYIIAIFIDPLIKGFEIYKIAYKERNFPYATARLGGLVAVAAFYFVAAQEPFNLLKSGYYNYLAVHAETEGNDLLAKEYILQSSYLGYNTHYPNYWLGKNEEKNQSLFAAKTYFYNAAQRFPSEFSLINYGNLDLEINSNKVRAVYEEMLRKNQSKEVQNNLGVLLLQKGEKEQSLDFFQDAQGNKGWNNAAEINKWNALKKLEIIDSISIEKDFLEGNLGVKSNILTTQVQKSSLSLDLSLMDDSRPLHKQAFLLNSAFFFDDDTLESLIRKEVDNSSDATFNSRMRKALALHLYNKGEVNKAFMMFDYLQANAHQYYKGEYLNALGKLALEQEAYILALDFFDQAIEVKHIESLFGKIDALAHLEREKEIPDLLLKSLRKNPELTERVNNVLARLESFSPKKKAKFPTKDISTLSEEELQILGSKNAFDESQLIAVVNQLQQKGFSGGYELLMQAIEINPYSTNLLKRYALEALNWNLIDYADQTINRIKELEEPSAFANFLIQYEAEKERIATESW